MSDQIEKYINVVPHIRVRDIKRELKEEEEDPYHCRLCNKGFASEVALRNHARMEHVDAYASGNSAVWMQVNDRPTTSKLKDEDKKVIKIKQEPKPAYVMTLASQDVSYIIVKDDGSELKRRRVEKVPKKEKPEKVVQKKEAEPITGPFECLEPSGVVPGGVCHQMFFSCCEYSSHFRTEHTRRKKGARCQVCERPLAAAPGEEPAPYACDVCGAGFQTSKELCDHTAIAHIKLKPFECSICHKRFTQQGGVQQHMRMHTGDRPFPCTFCPKAFTQKSGLDQHLRIHTKVKPYRCVVCGKTFCQSIHLKQHMRTHNNVTPFQCGICNKKFKQSSHLNYHLKNHNPPIVVSEEEKAKLVHFLAQDGTCVEVYEEKSEQDGEMEQCLEQEIEYEQETQEVEAVQIETEVDSEWILPDCG